MSVNDFSGTTDMALARLIGGKTRTLGMGHVENIRRGVRRTFG